MTTLTKLKRNPIKIKPTTTLDIGTSFEKHCLKYLNDELYMNLRRVGGAGDGGIDLRGYWYLPNTNTRSKEGEGSRRIRVIAQCKAESKKLGPRAIRELEGVMSNLRYRNDRSSTPTPIPTSGSSDSSEDIGDNAEADSRSGSVPGSNPPDIGILCSQSGFTKSTMLYSNTSNIPLMLIHIPGGRPIHDDERSESVKGDKGNEPKNEEEDGDGKRTRDRIEVQSLWWNKSLSQGILGDQLEIRKTINMNNGNDGGSGVGIGLWMNGKKLGRCYPESEVD